MTPRSLCYILLGYLSGSVLFAKLALALFGKEDALRDSCDENPGTANAFQCGGLLCGLMTLSGDLLKGYLPMRLYLAPDRVLLLRQPVFALVLLAPVLGTVLPVFSHFRGGKGIAVTFGCLLGLFPECRPLLAFTGSFLLFTLLYTPCVAAVATIRRELGSRLATVGVVLMQCGVACVVAALVYQLGRLL